MQDAEAIAAAILTGATGIGAVIRWAINRVVKSIDDNAAVGREVIKENTAALREFSKDAALLKERLSTATGKVDKVHDFIEEEISGVHDDGTKRSRTPGGGYHVTPQKRRGG